jgi:hypothetical protein
MYVLVDIKILTLLLLWSDTRFCSGYEQNQTTVAANGSKVLSNDQLDTLFLNVFIFMPLHV